MDKIICLRCSSENNDDYKFCINCGASLPKNYSVPFKESVTTEEAQDTYTNKPLTFDGVSIYEMDTYIGKNTEKILPKMQNMQKFNQRVSFCFPVFILGLFFGFIGMSMWFFYRKMKKAGTIFLLLGLLFTLSDLFVNLGAITQLISGYFSVFKDIVLDSGANPDLAVSAFERLLEQYNASYIGIFSFINQYIGGMICPVLMGMFGLHFYKKKAVTDIKAIKETAPLECFLGEIALKGGTSARLVLIPVFFYLITITVSLIILFVSL